MRRRLLFIVGTRPEAIKMAPVIEAARRRSEFEVRVCVTGQHREMVDDVFAVFGIAPDFDLDIMSANQSLTQITERALAGVDELLARSQYDWILVQGDTTSAFVAGLSAFYNKVRVAHVEAGLRSGSKHEPWPEEVNRRLISVIADLHCAPTEVSRRCLLEEGYADDTIVVTGNTVVDALHSVVGRLGEDEIKARHQAAFEFLDADKKLVLVTAHRRETFGTGFQEICEGLKRLSDRDDIELVYPVHLNPNVRQPVFETLSNISNIFLVDPMNYLDFVYFMQRAEVILTDSGGIQEEACALQKPVLVLRNRTERVEAIEVGTARLVGTKPESILSGLAEVLDGPKTAARAGNPYGDGHAAEHIIDALLARPH